MDLSILENTILSSVSNRGSELEEYKLKQISNYKFLMYFCSAIQTSPKGTAVRLNMQERQTGAGGP